MDAAAVDAYLERIGAARPASPDADALRTLQLNHLRAVPFENLSLHPGEQHVGERRPAERRPAEPHVARPGHGEEIVLTEQALLDKIVGARRGGFCYELNGAFAALLGALGYDVELLSARVLGAGGPGIPYDHLALRVRTPQGPMLADVGFGRHSHYPLRLDSRGDQPDPGGVFRIEEAAAEPATTGAPGETVEAASGRRAAETTGAYGDLDVFRDGVAQYRLEQRPRALGDFEAGCWWHRTSPRSHFTQGPICSRLTATGRITLSGRTLVITSADGTRDERELSADEVLPAYRTHFGITLDREPRKTT